MSIEDLTVNANENEKLFCLEIASEMAKIFNISISEAIGRINNQWKGVRIDGMVYHHNAESWAKTIYYENGAFWWVDEWMAKHTPKPKPYPKL